MFLPFQYTNEPFRTLWIIRIPKALVFNHSFIINNACLPADLIFEISRLVLTLRLYITTSI